MPSASAYWMSSSNGPLVYHLPLALLIATVPLAIPYRYQFGLGLLRVENRDTAVAAPLGELARNATSFGGEGTSLARRWRRWCFSGGSQRISGSAVSSALAGSGTPVLAPGLR